MIIENIPFRQQYNAMGHAVRSNYLYAGVTDVYAETGEDQLMKNPVSYTHLDVYKRQALPDAIQKWNK